MSNEAKLAELRAKTDRELLIVIEHELDRALKLAKVSRRFGEAANAYRTAIVLLLKSAERCGRRRLLIEAKVKALRFSLDHPAMATVQEFGTYAA